MVNKNFANEVRAIIEKRVTGAEVTVSDVTKNNNQIFTGVAIKPVDSNIAQCIYLEEIIDEFGEDVNAVADEVFKIYEKSGISCNFDTNIFASFESAKNNIVKVLVNKSMNEEMLDAVPHKNYLDMVYVYKIRINMEGVPGAGFVMVSNQMLDAWNICIEDLDEIAEENTAKLLPTKIDGLFETLAKMMDIPEDMIPMLVPTDGPKMYVISNNLYQNGAGAAFMYDNQALSEIADKEGKDLYILPSSIHETIVVPFDNAFELNELTELVKEVNGTEVAPNEVLSDNAYFYDRAKNLVSIVA